MPFAPGFCLALLVNLADPLYRIPLVHFGPCGEGGGRRGQRERRRTGAEAKSRAPSHIVWHADRVVKTVCSRGPCAYPGHSARQSTLSTGPKRRLVIGGPS